MQPCVLVVDDEPGIRQLLRIVLSREGYVVETVPDGGAAIERLDRDPRPDLIILDLKMPVRSGTEVLRRVREDDRWDEVPVLVISGSAGLIPLHEEDTLVSTVTKPFDLDDLIEEVDRLLTAPTQALRAGRRHGADAG